MQRAAPGSAEEVASIMMAAGSARHTVVVQGGGTKAQWGPPAPPADVELSTARLSRVVAHRFGDLTATVEAGTTLTDTNRELAQHGQWIPLDPPFGDRATIGGIVSTNDSGPRRHRYGAPRDLIIGVEFVRADGRLAKGGGIVVKNVAGYDLPRLMTGAFGSLGVITTATFKLSPLPSASATLVADVPGLDNLAALTAAMLASPLTPSALEFATHPLRLLVRFESIEAAVVQQSATAAALIERHAPAPRIITGSEEMRAWQEHEAAIWSPSRSQPSSQPNTVVKISVLPSEVPTVLAALDRDPGGNAYVAAGRAGLGVFAVRFDGDIESAAAAIQALRSRIPAERGSVVIVRGSEALRSRVDVWGPLGDARRVMEAVKRQFDPDGLLNPGRGPGGI